MRHFSIESEETILSEVRKSVRRDFDAMVRSEKQIKSKLRHQNGKGSTPRNISEKFIIHNWIS